MTLFQYILPDQGLPCFQHTGHHGGKKGSDQGSDPHRKHPDRQDRLKPERQVGDADQEQHHPAQPQNHGRDTRCDQARPFQQAQRQPYRGQHHLEYHAHIASPDQE